MNGRSAAQVTQLGESLVQSHPGSSLSWVFCFHLCFAPLDFATLISTQNYRHRIYQKCGEKKQNLLRILKYKMFLPLFDIYIKKIIIIMLSHTVLLRVSSRGSSPRSSTWPGRTTASPTTPLTSWTLWLWSGPSGPDRTSPWWCTAGRSLNLSLALCNGLTDGRTDGSAAELFVRLLLQRGHRPDGRPHHHGDGVVSDGERPAGVSSGHRPHHEGPEGYDDPDACRWRPWLSPCRCCCCCC